MAPVTRATRATNNTHISPKANNEPRANTACPNIDDRACAAADATRPMGFDKDAAWTKCANDVWAHEEIAVKKWGSEIDTLLVFAGLFSAVLTSFVVQYYPTLQGSQQGSSGQTSSSQPVTATEVAINVLWFLALVLSLTAASVGISVKQWLARYIAPDSIAPRQRARIWLLRHDSLTAWHVPEIIATLPLLLQLSLAFFLIGMIILLWTMNHIVAGIVMAPVAILLLCTVATAFIPTFIPGCPYKSQQAWWLYLLLRRLTLFDGTIARQLQGRWRFLMDTLKSVQPTKDWTDRENHWLRQNKAGISKRYHDLNVLVAADKLIRDDQFMENIILPSLQESSSADALPAFLDLVESRAHLVVPGVPGFRGSKLKWFAGETDSDSIVALGKLTLSMLTKRMQSGMHTTLTSDLTRIFSVLDELLSVTPQSHPSLFLKLVDLCCKYRSLGGLLYLVTRHEERFAHVVDDISDDQGIILVDCVFGFLGNRPQGPSDVQHARPEASQALSLLERLLVHWPKSRAPSTHSIVYGRLCVFLEAVNISQYVRLRLVDIVYKTHRHSSRLRIPPTAVQSLVISLEGLFRDQNIGHPYKIRLLEVTNTFLSYLAPEKLSGFTRTLIPVLRNAVGLRMSSQNFWETRAYLRNLVKLHQTAARCDATPVSDDDCARLRTYVATNTAVWRAAQWWDKCAAELDEMLDELQKLCSRDPAVSTGVQRANGGVSSCLPGHGSGSQVLASLPSVVSVEVRTAI